MGASYIEKLQDPRWQKKRLEILSRDKFECQCCGDTETTLHVHHLLYKRGLDPWEYDERELVTLCKNCHEEETEIRQGEEAVLLEALSIGRYIPARELYSISLMLMRIRLIGSIELTMDAISFAMTDEETLKTINDKYLAHLKGRSGKNE